MEEDQVGNVGGLIGADAGSPAASQTGVEGSSPTPAGLIHGPEARRIETELESALRDQTIEQVSVKVLKPRARNARAHSTQQIKQIAASIRQFGFLGAIVIDRSSNVLAGHGRLAAAKLLAMPTVPCVRVEHLDEASKAAFALADNRLAELSGWDEDMLKLELKELETLADLDLEVTGFDTVDLDRMLGPNPDPNVDPDDRVPELEDSKPAVSRRGDLWVLGDHRLLCIGSGGLPSPLEE